MKIRIGNDFKTKWAITWLGEPEDFSDATDIALFFNIYDKKIELTKDVDYTITNNIIEIDVTPDICNILGVYNLELHYTKPNDDFIDGERRSAVDIDAFRIVGKSDKADSTQDVSIISDAVAIFLDVAYKKLEEIEANEDVRIANEEERVTEEDIRISNEQDRQINTATAISNAEQATSNANNSAVYANEQGAYANEQGAYAEEMSSHPPTIINDYWHIWNLNTNQYESTGQYARGDSAIDGALVVQEKGQSAVNTMSQKAVTDELVQLESEIGDKITISEDGEVKKDGVLINPKTTADRVVDGEGVGLDVFTAMKKDANLIPFSNKNQYRRTSDGVLVNAPGTNVHTTEIIRVEKGDYFYLKFKGLGNYAQAIFYDANKNYIQGVIGQDFVVVPEGVKYIAFNTYNIPNDTVIASDSFTKYLNKFEDIEKNRAEIDIINLSVVDKSLIKFEKEGYYHKDTGILIPNSDYLATEIMSVKKGMIFQLFFEFRGAGNAPQSILFDSAMALSESYYDVDVIEIPHDGFIAFTKRVRWITDYVVVPYSFLKSGDNSIIGNAQTNINYPNPTDVSYHLTNYGRLQIKFRLKKDFNKNGVETTLLQRETEGFNVKVVGGLTTQLTYRNDLTTSEEVICQRQLPTIKVHVGDGVSTEILDFNGAYYETFLGSKLFSIHYTGAVDASSLDYQISCKNNELIIANGITIIKTYNLTTITTVRALIDAIQSDIDGGVLANFKVRISTINNKFTSDIASFEPVKLVSDYPTMYEGANKIKAFPFYVREIDKKIHTLEIIRRSNTNADENVWVVLDGIIKKIRFNTMLNQIHTTAKLNNDTNSTVLNFEAKDGERQMSFPVIMNFYSHSIIPDYSDDLTVASNLARINEFADEMDARGAVSVTMKDVADHLINGKSIPRLSYILNFDDSIFNMAMDKKIRRVFQKRGLKPHTSCIVQPDRDRIEFLVRVDATFIGGAAEVGMYFQHPSISVKATYVGTSQLTGQHVFKFVGRRAYNSYFEENKNFEMPSVDDPSISVRMINNNIAIADRLEIYPVSEHTRLNSNINQELKESGFNLNLHDYSHLRLFSFDYDDFEIHVEQGQEQFRQLFGEESPYYTYPYGYITPMHADVIAEHGFRLGFTSDKTNYGVITTVHDKMLLPRGTFDRNRSLQVIGREFDEFI